MSEQITEKWLERIDNLLEVQKYECLEYISTRFTRRELIELRLMISTIADMTKGETGE